MEEAPRPPTIWRPRAISPPIQSSTLLGYAAEWTTGGSVDRDHGLLLGEGSDQYRDAIDLGDERRCEVWFGFLVG
jgi:hypothetical protein